MKTQMIFETSNLESTYFYIVLNFETKTPGAVYKGINYPEKKKYRSLRGVRSNSKRGYLTYPCGPLL